MFALKLLAQTRRALCFGELDYSIGARGRAQTSEITKISNYQFCRVAASFKKAYVSHQS